MCARDNEGASDDIKVAGIEAQYLAMDFPRGIRLPKLWSFDD
jgi:hypothetical protein